MDIPRSEEQVRMPLQPVVVTSLRLSVSDRGEDTEMPRVGNTTESSSQVSPIKQVSLPVFAGIFTSFGRIVQAKGNYNS